MPFRIGLRPAVGVVLLTTASLIAACGSSGSGSSKTAATGGTPTATGKSVTYIQGEQDPLYNSVNCGASAAAKAAGLKYHVAIPQTFAPAAQIPVLNSVVASHPDAILISVTDTKSLIAPLKVAASQGIKIITVSNTVTDPSFLTANIAGDNSANGRRSADLLGRLAGGRKGDVAFLGFQRGGSSITDARQDGFIDQLKKYPNLRFIGVSVVGNSFDSGAQVANALLSAHPDLLGAAGVDLYASQPFARVVQERHKTGKVITIAMDATEGDVKNLKAGLISGIEGDRFREMGASAVQQAVNALSDRPVQKQVTTQPIELTKDNVNSPETQQYVYKTSGC